MSLSDRVAIVALVVSLAALVIALLQAAQMFLGTADRYRNCRKEVMGAWAARTSPPEIDLMTPMQFVEKATPPGSRRRGPYHLNVEAPQYATEEIYHTVQPNEDIDRDSESMVSWLPLLRSLHETYAAYRQTNVKTRTAIRPLRRAPTGRFLQKLDANSQSPYEKLAPPAKDLTDRRSSKLQRTDVAITYREMSWDFAPPEIVRPVAITRLGPLIILAARLGMRWQALDLDAGTIRAAGNGFSLSTTRVRGMGMVIEFSREPGKHVHHDLIPSEAVDKMICGILPACAELVGGDGFPVIGEDRAISLAYVQNLLDSLRVSTNAIEAASRPETLRKHGPREGNWHVCPLNEGLILLCPFMPLRDADCYKIPYSGWFGRIPRATVTFYEGRVILLSEISKRGRTLTDAQHQSKLKFVHRVLSTLESEYPDIWYGDYTGINDGPCLVDHGRVQTQNKTRKELASTCRSVFEETTRYFQDLDLGWSKRLGPHRQYKVLVAAHISFGVRVASWIRDQEKKGHRSGSIYLDKFGEWPVPEDLRKEQWRVAMIAKSVADVAWAYIDCKDWFFEDVRRRLDDQSINIDDGSRLQDLTIEEAWWMLVLRAVCWAMSIEIDIPAGGEIPASFYGMRTPVWIT